MTPRHYNSLRWKLCAGCETVIAQSRSICQHCHSYRFDPIEVPPMTKGDLKGWDLVTLTKLYKTLAGK